MLYNNLDLKKNIFLHAREDQKMGLGRQMAAIRVVIWKGLIFSTGPYGIITFLSHLFRGLFIFFIS